MRAEPRSSPLSSGSPDPMRYFVTGASGFLGGVIARQLRDAGHDVVALVRRPETAPQLSRIGIDVRAGDITDRESVRSAMVGVDGVFHAAAWFKVRQSSLTPGARDARGGMAEAEEAYRANVVGTRNVLETMRDLGIPRGVYTSTIAVYGDTKGRVVDGSERPERPTTSVYDETKWRAHYEVAEPLIAAGLPLVIVQPGVVYGVGDRGPVRGAVDAYLRRRLPIAVASTAYSWGHVEDTAAGHRLAMERGRAGESYILAGPSHTFVEALRIAESITGIPVPRVVIPGALATAAALVLRTEAMRVIGATYLGSSAKAQRELGFTARPLRDGFAEVLPAHLADLRSRGLIG
jgi:dihydroflavonol-4-reductase